MKYYTSIEYKNNNNQRYIDELIFNATNDYNKADYKIRQYITEKYSDYQLIDIRIMPLAMFEQITIK